jgi:hypothetical protein
VCLLYALNSPGTNKAVKTWEANHIFA